MVSSCPTGMSALPTKLSRSGARGLPSAQRVIHTICFGILVCFFLCDSTSALLAASGDTRCSLEEGPCPQDCGATFSNARGIHDAPETQRYFWVDCLRCPQFTGRIEGCGQFETGFASARSSVCGFAQQSGLFGGSVFVERLPNGNETQVVAGCSINSVPSGEFIRNPGITAFRVLRKPPNCGLVPGARWQSHVSTSSPQPDIASCVAFGNSVGERFESRLPMFWWSLGKDDDDVLTCIVRDSTLPGAGRLVRDPAFISGHSSVFSATPDGCQEEDLVAFDMGIRSPPRMLHSGFRAGWTLNAYGAPDLDHGKLHARADSELLGQMFSSPISTCPEAMCPFATISSTKLRFNNQEEGVQIHFRFLFLSAAPADEARREGFTLEFGSGYKTVSLGFLYAADGAERLRIIPHKSDEVVFSIAEPKDPTERQYHHLIVRWPAVGATATLEVDGVLLGEFHPYPDSRNGPFAQIGALQRGSSADTYSPTRVVVNAFIVRQGAASKQPVLQQPPEPLVPAPSRTRGPASPGADTKRTILIAALVVTGIIVTLFVWAFCLVRRRRPGGRRSAADAEVPAEVADSVNQSPAVPHERGRSDTSSVGHRVRALFVAGVFCMGAGPAGLTVFAQTSGGDVAMPLVAVAVVFSGIVGGLAAVVAWRNALHSGYLDSCCCQVCYDPASADQRAPLLAGNAPKR